MIRRFECRQFEVLDVAWDATLGSEALDMLLLDHFAEEFGQLHPGLDPRDSHKVSSQAIHYMLNFPILKATSHYILFCMGAQRHTSLAKHAAFPHPAALTSEQSKPF